MRRLFPDIALILRIHKEIGVGTAHYETDPLCCPKCGAEMKVIAFIEKRDQPDVVEKILRHCGLWDRPASRAPPEPAESEQLDLELHYVDTDEFLMAL